MRKYTISKETRDKIKKNPEKYLIPQEILNDLEKRIKQIEDWIKFKDWGVY